MAPAGSRPSDPARWAEGPCKVREVFGRAQHEGNPVNRTAGATILVSGALMMLGIAVWGVFEMDASARVGGWITLGLVAVAGIGVGVATRIKQVRSRGRRTQPSGRMSRAGARAARALIPFVGGGGLLLLRSPPIGRVIVFGFLGSFSSTYLGLFWASKSRTVGDGSDTTVS